MSETVNNSVIQNLEDQFEIPVYPKRGITITKGMGAVLEDAEGYKYIDCVAGIGVANIGHSHPKLVKAISEQASQLITCPEIFANDIRANLMKKLVDITPAQLDQVYLCNSGTEATEAAIKFARIATGKSGIITAMRGFHGRTMGSLSGTFNRKYRKPFAPLVPGFDFVPFNKIEKLEESITPDTAAVMLEVIQGNGGIHIADKTYLQAVRKLCDDLDILLILDEVQTGWYRTGSLFAFEQYDITPDILTLAKAMGGGVPIGSVIVNSKKIKIGKSLHGSTFGGNPLASAAALTAIEIMEEENLARQAEEKGAYFYNQLKSIESPLIRDIRQRGLMIGIELRTRVYSVLQKLQEQGILAGPAGSTVIRLLPPLVITQEQIDQVISALSNALETENTST